MKRIILAIGLLVVAAMATSCSDTNDPVNVTPSRTPGVSTTVLSTVHDYTNVTIDPGHFLVTEGQAGAQLISSVGPINIGRGGVLPNCPYDDTWTGGLFAATPEDHAEAFDRLWYQIIAFGSEVVFDLGHPYSRVYIALSQDHGPYPEEAIEYRVWVSNNPAGPFAMLPVETPITTYAGGWSAAGEYDGDCDLNGVLNDDYSAMWTLPGAYRYIKLTPIADTGSYNEPEIDAVMGAGAFRVSFDIRPTSCPNPLNPKSKGVIPAAILGGPDFDVTLVDPASLTLMGVSPLRWDLEDVATPADLFQRCDCNEAGADGYMDLTLKFDTEALLEAIGPVAPRSVLTLSLTGSLLDGTPFEARDCMTVVGGAPGQPGTRPIVEVEQ